MMKRLITALIFLLLPIASFAQNNTSGDIPIACDGGAILVEYKTSKALFEKNADKRWPPASITKVMTAILALEKGDARDEILFSENATAQDGSKLGVKKGMRVPLYSLLEAMLVKSGNDAAVAIAEHIAGSEKEFVKMMNTKARAIGMMDTNFTNASGMPDENQYTTARDLSKLAIYALGREDFRRIVCKRQVEFINSDGTENQTIYTTNRLLGRHPLVDGIKTGFTVKSKYCLAASACFRDYRLVAIVLGAERKSIWDETAKLIDWGFVKYDPMYPIYWDFRTPVNGDYDETSNTEE